MIALTRTFDPLHDDFDLDFRVQRVQNGHVVLSIAMPEGLLRGFVPLLQSLHGFFRFADLKSRIAKFEEQPISPAEIEERRAVQDGFRNEVCATFDALIGQGLERKEAVKRTNQALKANNHPWASHATVTDILRAAGRFRSGKRRGGVKPS
jgi:hypothetical protein